MNLKSRGLEWLLPFGELTSNHIFAILSATSMKINPEQNLKQWSLNGKAIHYKSSQKNGSNGAIK